MAAQGATVLAALGGSIYYAESRQRAKVEDRLESDARLRSLRPRDEFGNKESVIVTSTRSQRPDWAADRSQEVDTFALNPPSALAPDRAAGSTRGLRNPDSQAPRPSAREPKV